MGATKDVCLRSTGIPLGVTSETARAVLARGFRRQPVSQERIDKMMVIRVYVLGYIDKFGSVEDKCEWEQFFAQLIPEEPLTENNCPLLFDTYLHKLFEEYGGPPRRKCRNHCRPRETLSKYTEPMVFPESAWSQGERDASAQYAVSTDTTNSILVSKGDLKRVPKKRGRKVLKGDSGMSLHLKGETAKKGSSKRCVTILDDKATKKRGRQKKKAKSAPPSSDNEESVCSGSTVSSTYAPSMKSGDDSDLGSGFALSDTDAGSVTSAVSSNFSTTDLTEFPVQMKFKELGNSYKDKVGKRFRDTETDVLYRIISLCRYDNDDVIGERGKLLLVEKLCFKYIPDETSLSDEDFDVEDIETSLCSEMMSDTCDWVQWLEE